jgi:signal transduction histidine kinase
MIDSNELAKKVRVHKHNYAGEFGNIAVDPIASLVDELIANPEAFDKSERAEILEGYCKALQIKGIYEILGYDLDKQLAKVKEEMVPQIRNNCLLLKEIISKERHYFTPYLIEIINWANSNTDDLCSKLNHIEDDDKGEARPISIINIIEKEFEEDREIRTRKGHPSFECSIFGRRDCSDTKVFLDPDGFKKNVIGNIIQNIHKHAFADDMSMAPKINNQTIKIPWWKRLWSLFSRKKPNFSIPTILDRRVQIKFSQEEPEYVKVVIENNGKPFPANIDLSKIFEYGVSNGEGEGIGLYSAADFLRKFGSTIEAESTPNDEFTVHLIIKIPVYGKQV